MLAPVKDNVLRDVNRLLTNPARASGDQGFAPAALAWAFRMLVWPRVASK